MLMYVMMYKKYVFTTILHLFRVDLQKLVYRSTVFLSIELQPQNVWVAFLLRVAVVPGKLIEAQAKQHMLQENVLTDTIQSFHQFSSQASCCYATEIVLTNFWAVNDCIHKYRQNFATCKISASQESRCKRAAEIFWKLEKLSEWGQWSIRWLVQTWDLIYVE